ncbi:hypothetical protein BGZ76_011404 [Entomortierella beljakovae]|nr:hypothetical protein BGZ76_011404 [Entomortierella beljakovae]
MAPSVNGSLKISGTRTSSRTKSSSLPKPNAIEKNQAGKPTASKKSTNMAPSKATKRQAKSISAVRKRAKREVTEDEEEEQEESDENGGDDEEDYDDQEDDEESQDSDADDFQDSTYFQKSKGQSTKSSRSTKKTQPAKSEKSGSSLKLTTKSSTRKSVNPDLLPAPTKTFLVSALVIPHPKGGPVADAIQPETLEFIRDLKLNNDREYMMLNQARCDQAKADFMDFIRMVKEGLLEADPDIMDQEPKDSMMRIYRDVRFSNDKSPYKSQFACFFSRGGKKSIAAGYYLGVSSGGETFVGCGTWDPSGPVLHRIRQGIMNESERFTAILETDAMKKLTGKTGIDVLRPGSSRLKTGPAGVDKNHPMIEFLKRKCFAIGRSFSDKEVVSEGFLEEVLQTYDAGVELVQILNEWIG